MLLDRRTVSRKTPLDGRLEISADSATRLAALGAAFSVVSLGRRGAARLESASCTCAKGASGGHRHHFVSSSVLRDLAPGTEVSLELDEERSELRVDSA